MTGRRKGVSIGAAMKQRMGQGDAAAAEPAAIPATSPLPASPPPASPPPAEALESFNTRLPAGLHRRLKLHAVAEGRKIQDVVQEALADYLSQKESK